jgi:hypothetical protein
MSTFFINYLDSKTVFDEEFEYEFEVVKIIFPSKHVDTSKN